MPKGTPDQAESRLQAIQGATRHAIEVPMEVARISLQGMELAELMAEKGNPNSITDAGVGAMAIRTGVLGAILNARVNVVDLDDKVFAAQVLEECDEMWNEVDRRERRILAHVNAVLKK